MKHRKTINFFDNKINQPPKFTTKSWVQINDDARGTDNTNTQIKFKTTMLKSTSHHINGLHYCII